jgi:tRNA threonylcarbamoyladenosine biosynthesis protein TsaB
VALILNIDTATEKAGVCLASKGKSLAIIENTVQKEQASWLHPAVEETLQITGYRLRDLQAVAVTGGPGSYTGLRVGMAAAKGFCYALGIPLIAEDTLKVMAFAGHEQLPGSDLLCPMIDARRMEVGGGSDKCKPIIHSSNASFPQVVCHAGYLGKLSFLRYLQGEFTGLAYSEPVYTKEFYTHTRK